MLRLEGWALEPTQGGVMVRLPDGSAEIRIPERLSPRVPLATLVDAGLAELGAQFATRSETLEVETDEGECGVMLSLSATRANGRPLDWTLALIEAEDTYL